MTTQATPPNAPGSGAPDPNAIARIHVVGPLLAGRLGDPAWREARAELVSGGKSNLTFRVRSAAGTSPRSVEEEDLIGIFERSLRLW